MLHPLYYFTMLAPYLTLRPSCLDSRLELRLQRKELPAFSAAAAIAVLLQSSCLGSGDIFRGSYKVYVGSFTLCMVAERANKKIH